MNNTDLRVTIDIQSLDVENYELTSEKLFRVLNARFDLAEIDLYSDIELPSGEVADAMTTLRASAPKGKTLLARRAKKMDMGMRVRMDEELGAHARRIAPFSIFARFWNSETKEELKFYDSGKCIVMPAGWNNEEFLKTLGTQLPGIKIRVPPAES